MLSLLTNKWALGGLAGLVVVTILSLGYRHYDGLLNEVETLRARQAQLETGLEVERSAVRSLRGVVDDWEESQDRLLIRLDRMQEVANEATSETRRLRQLFAEMDLEGLAPAAADSVVRSTVDRLWRLLESASRPTGHGAGGAPAGEAPAPGPGAGGDAAGGVDGAGD